MANDAESPVLPVRVKLKIGCGVSWLFVACVIIAAAFFLHFQLTSLVRQGILEMVIVDSPSAKGFPQWQSNTYDGAPPLYQAFTFFNLTNPVDVLEQGFPPLYEEVGPFTYSFLQSKFDIDFAPDGNTVSFREYQRYHFEPSLSPYAEDTLITNINPAYLGVLQNAGGDEALQLAFIGPLLNSIIDFLSTTYVELVCAEALPAVLAGAQQRLLNGSADVDGFLSVWANSTVYPSSEWAGMLVSVGGTATGISQASARRLFDASARGSLLDASSADQWFSTLQGDPSARAALTAENYLQPSQMAVLLTWLRGSFQDNVLAPSLTARFGVGNVSDLGALQWAQGIVTPGRSAQTIFPQWGGLWDMPPEFGLFPGAVTNPMSVDVVKQLIDGPYGLSNALNVGVFAKMVLPPPISNATYAKVEAMWGLTRPVCNKFIEYFLEAAVLARLTRPSLKAIFLQGGGLVTTRTAHSWLFDAVDPLLEYMQPAQPNARLMVNFTSEDQVRALGLTTQFTGKDDPTKIAWYVQYQGSSLQPGYNFNMSITGTDEWGQFPPLLGAYDVLQPFNANYFRIVPLVPVATSEVLGVPTQHYLIDNATWAVDPKFFDSIVGFANMTGVLNAPAFYSNPHFFGCDPKWPAMLPGTQQPDWHNDLTVVDVEPLTGKVVNVSKYLQVNFYIEPDSAWFLMFNPRFPTGLMYPVIYAREYATVTPALAKQIIDEVYHTLMVQDYSLSVGLPVGFVLLALMLWLSIDGIVQACKWKRTADSERGHRLIQ
eukprot:TRINITY_DN24168_c0_g1_i1.p1 TRINITY_DN24168_c0_g1~~TRINITY_DN24168_c0_g1_i1.p1  ORF type:complete len:770 (-),score=188.90 TRINITY_DN24168_c0_g1_i1:661-2970(-)